MKLDPQLKADWTAALRSGHFGQCVKRLNRNNTNFCCLGVLCEIQHLKKSRGSAGIYEDNNVMYYRYGCDDSQSAYSLPDRFRQSINMSLIHMEQLQRMNDGGSSFEEIAQWIEDNL